MIKQFPNEEEAHLYVIHKWVQPCLECSEHICINDLETKKLRGQLKDYVFVDVRKFDKNGKPKYFEEFWSTDEKPQQIYNRNYQTPDSLVLPGIHYRDVKYHKPVVQHSVQKAQTPKNYKSLLLSVLFVLWIWFCFLYTVYCLFQPN